jgi:hypothetical protein
MTSLRQTAEPSADRVGYAAAAWAAGYGTLALAWTATGRGFPFGTGDSGNHASVLRALSPEVGAPLFAGLLLATAVAVLAMVGRAEARGASRALLLGIGWSMTAVLLVVVPDVRLLTLAGYAPILLLGAPFGWPPVDYGNIFTWTLANQVLCVIGGFLLARAVLTWQLRTVGACISCGRGDRDTEWTSATAAARWGRWAAYTAAVIPALYAVTRLAWAAGIPLGISSGFLREMRDTGLVWAGLGLGTFAIVGSILTLGLVQRWGEVLPRWMIGVAGRRVPIKLAVVPATLVAFFVTSASLGFFTADGFFQMGGGVSLATLPALLWPLWGIALGAAALAYYLRRRGSCARCGAGTPATSPGGDSRPAVIG